MRPRGRSLADFGSLGPAEKILLDCARDGTIAVIAESRPEQEEQANRVRADFVRFLALGGDERAPVHESGVQLAGAWLEGPLNLIAATIDRQLTIWDCRIETVEAYQARLRGFILFGCRLSEGLTADRIHCEGHFLLRACHVTGPVRLLGARVEGDLDCSDARFQNPGGYALHCDGAIISGSIFLSGGFRAEGGIHLTEATISSVLDCSGASLSNREGKALSCDGSRIGGSVFLDKGFYSAGEVRMLGARIGGALHCGRGLFRNVRGNALSFDRAVVSGSVFLTGRCYANGTVRLPGATIGSNLECCGGRFASRTGVAIQCDGARISGHVLLNSGFRAKGEIALTGASIAGDLACSDAEFVHEAGSALSCNGARVERSFFLRRIARLAGGVDLGAMRVANLCDDPASLAAVRGRLALDGFTYERLIGAAPTDAAARIAWLDLQVPDHLGSDFKPQPWEQLIAVLRAMGHPDEARAVAVEKQNRLRQAGRLPRGARPFHWLYGALVGYGYRPLRLLAVTAAIWLVCAAAYWWAANPGSFGPAAHLVAPPAREGQVARPDYSNFVPLIYSADVLLPVVDLGYKDEWQPVVSRDGKPLPAGQLLRFLYWFEIAFGWVAGLLLVGVLGNLVKKD